MASSVEMHVKPDFKYEEAAHAATDVIMSLENLPGEVSFLLAEIREKDQRIMLLQDRISGRHYALTKHPSRAMQNGSASTSASAASHANAPVLPIPPGAPIPLDHLSQKEAQAMSKIQSEWEKIEVLQDEKVKLAERMERIMKRARERAKAEWLRVGGIDVDELESEHKGWEMGSGEIVLPPSGLGTGSDIRQKKRRPQALPLPPPSGPIVHPPSSMAPPPAPSRPSLSARSSLASNQPQPRGGRGNRARHKSMSSTMSDADDLDAEGEMELADGEGEPDDKVYCTCQSKSYGEMIGCDNDDCKYEWFHLKCVGVTNIPEDWFCPDCVRKGAHLKKNKKKR